MSLDSRDRAAHVLKWARYSASISSVYPGDLF
jgi:hypothetical protein